ncbi:50S ribosomal protein L23 [Candidatus Woesearchaeota archaeon]|nr:50S ribosomal protein L23 [Candidatus Woesearchaeota archaeon]
MDARKIVKYPLTTEKSIRLMEAENKLLFVVDAHATKQQIKLAIESLFSVKVLAVNTSYAPTGEKRAYVRFSSETPAIDIVTNLGLM